MDYVIAPFTVIADSREQAMWKFTGYTADACHWRRVGDPPQIIKPPLIIPVEVACLKTGDYSIKGMEHRISIERKNKDDAFSTFSPTGGRDRFIRELERLNQLEFAAVVIEASEGDCLTNPPSHTRFTPKAFWRSVTSWEVRYPRVHFYHGATRQAAERKALRWLEKFWKIEQEKLKLLAKESA